MRIVIAAVSAPSRLNGVSRHAANLVRGLLSLTDAPEIHFVAGAWQQQMFMNAIPHPDARLHYHWITIRNSSLSRVAWYARELPHVAAQLGADLVHYACPAPLRARSFGCPVVVTLHDLYPFDIPGNFGVLKGAVNRALMRQCLASAGAIACVSESTRGQLKKWLGTMACAKAVMIPNAVQATAPAAVRAPHPLRHNAPFLLCVAQHRKNKNIPLAISIFQRAVREGVLPAETRLLIVGIAGPATAEIRNHMRRSQIESSVLLLSGLSEAELQWCYRHCRVLLAPSRIEGFGLPVAEALMAGCPVVCSDIPAFREIGGEFCHYVAFGQGFMDAYARAIREALAEPRRPAVRMPELSPVRVAGQFMNLYRRMLRFPATTPYGMLRQPEAQRADAEAAPKS